MNRDAKLSEDRVYRYSLSRSWDTTDKQALVVIGLNPSTTDESEDDPTIRKCVKFAKTWGYGSLKMLNLYAFRATDPKQLLTAKDPVGPLNDEEIRSSTSTGKVLAAWGNGASKIKGPDRGNDLANFLFWRGVDLECLATNAGGEPKHPLYCKDDSKLILWPFEIKCFLPAAIVKGLVEFDNPETYFASCGGILEYKNQAAELGWIDKDSRLLPKGEQLYYARRLHRLCPKGSNRPIAELYDRATTFDWNELVRKSP